MKLTQILKQITPMPWLIVSATDGDKWIGTEQGDDRIATLDGNTQALDHRYLVHAANVLPAAVTALKLLLADQKRPKAELSRAQFEFCETALANAEQVQEEQDASGTRLARTTRKTVHGNPGERRTLPANILVAIQPASNLPAGSLIKYWARPVPGYPWPAETKAWAKDVGIGLGDGDITLLKKVSASRV